MSALRRAVEVDFKDKDKHKSQGLYLLTTGIPDQETVSMSIGFAFSKFLSVLISTLFFSCFFSFFFFWLVTIPCWQNAFLIYISKPA